MIKYMDYCGGNMCMSLLLEYAIAMQNVATSNGINCIPFSRKLAKIALNGAYSDNTIQSSISALKAKGLFVPSGSPYKNTKGDKWYTIVTPNIDVDKISLYQNIDEELSHIPSKVLSDIKASTYQFIYGSTKKAKPSDDNLVEVRIKEVPVIVKQVEVVEAIKPIREYTNDELSALMATLTDNGTLMMLKDANPIAFQMLIAKVPLLQYENTPAQKVIKMTNFNKFFDVGSQEYLECRHIFFLAKNVKEENYDYDELLKRFKPVADIQISTSKYLRQTDLTAHLCNWERVEKNGSFPNKIKTKASTKAQKVATVKNIAY